MTVASATTGVPQGAPGSLAQPSLSRPLISASPWLILIVLALGEFMILLDTTIVNVALPNMAADLHGSGDQILWVVNAYTLTFAVLLITAGRLGAMLGPKRLFLAGLLLFTGASAACASAQSPDQLILFRVLQAAGGAALTPQTLSIITSIFPPEKRGAAFGLWGAIYGLGGISGPTLGGLLTTTFSWRAIFVPNLPIGVLALLLAAAMMPELTARSRHRLDLPGVVLASVGLLAVISGLVEGQTYAWGRITSLAAFDLGPVHAGLLSIPSLFLAGALLLVAFVLWEARQDEPILPLSLFGDRNYALGCVVSAVQVFGMTGLFLPFSIYLQAGLHLTPLEAGFVVLPNALGAVAVAPIVGKTADRLNPKLLLMAGLSTYAIGMGLLIQLASPSASGLTFTVPLLVVGLGVGLTFAPMTSLTMQNIAPTASGAASGFMNTVRQVGSALSAAIGGAILFGRVGTEAHSQAAIAAVRVPARYRETFLQALGHAMSHLEIGGMASVRLPAGVPAGTGMQLMTLARMVVSQAFTNATRPALIVPLVVALGGVTLTTFMRSPQRGRASAHADIPAGETFQRASQLAPAQRTSLPVFSPLPASDTIVLPVSLPRQLQMSGAVGPRPAFLVQVGDAGGLEHPIGRALVLGRAPGRGVTVSDPLASRRHAAIVQVDGESILRDLDSTNGTRLNDQIISGDRTLRDGDVISIGRTSYVFHNDFDIARPRLIRTDTAREQTHALRTPLTIGRLRDNDVVVEHAKASRRHARVSLEAGTVTIRDLDSLNGTRVNGELVAGDHPLQNGDVIAVGGATFVYVVDVRGMSSR